jgi:hypothetical protein
MENKRPKEGRLSLIPRPQFRNSRMAFRGVRIKYARRFTFNHPSNLVSLKFDIAADLAG